MYYDGCTLEEILTYRELEGEVFDFGEGKMRIEGLLGSEDAYYEMCIPNESCYIDYDEFEFNYDTDKYEHIHHKTKPKNKIRLHQYYRKQIDQDRMKKLREQIWWGVRKKKSDNDKVYYKRDYVSNRRRWIRRRANKKVRKTKDVGNYSDYRRVYEFWWDIF